MATSEGGDKLRRFASYQGGKYDPDNFQIPATDGKGHSARAQCYCSPDIDRTVDEIMASKKFPFRTKGDLFRWALVEGVRKLVQLEPDIDRSYLQQAEAIMDTLRDVERKQAFEVGIRMAAARVGSLLNEGATGEARRVVSEILHKVRQMPKSYWRLKWEKQIVESWGHLLQGTGVSLLVADEDEEG